MLLSSKLRVASTIERFAITPALTRALLFIAAIATPKVDFLIFPALHRSDVEEYHTLFDSTRSMLGKAESRSFRASLRFILHLTK